MHSQNAAPKNKKHILELDYFKSNTAEYLESVVYKVKTILTSPESALFMSDIYDSEFSLSVEGDPVDDMLGPVLHRVGEDVTNYNNYNTLVSTYLKFDIQKFYGMSLLEFIDLPKDKIEILVRRAEKEIIKITEALEDVNDEIREENKRKGEY
jgi:hypothetical protein